MILNYSEFIHGKRLLIDKPWGYTSFEVVKKIRKKIRSSLSSINSLKIGHAGTLDPLATGLLIVLTGRYTKQVNRIQNYNKIYTGIIKLGCETPSFDSETEECNFSSLSHITPELIQQVSKKKFLGEIDQFPPYFSALQIKGKRSYEYARKGKKISHLKPRRVKIYQFYILKIRIPYIKFFIECGKGTYIRSIAKDFGQALKSGAYLLSLRREQIGYFSMNKPMELELSKIIGFPCYME
ncbi:tRNA pseudouridine(55) synthase TruB [Blattabacterium cuenoti]|uniref:tRNA pseudouridine(55) synthase TruB n=1 Tax=Blattabacterium cuenoti TaxID=1653831 RepID=UPI00163BCCF5|nr:tRNA pseudouridine(55) synthase TruB [Blattabacterium cuenoti]